MKPIRYRRNINCLSTDDLHDLREALAALYTLPATDSDSYEVLAGLHGQPVPTYCMHGAPGFLTWHRAYLQAFEKALQVINCDVMLPYWKWSSGPTTGVPAACASPTYVNRDGATVPNPLYSGPKPAAFGGGQTARRPDIDTTTFGDLATSAQNALLNGSFNGFSGQLDGAHGGIHVRVGGDMSSVAFAGYDPIFYLHHANVDRLWAQWQASHPAPLPVVEANLDLVPFSQPFGSGWRKGADMFNTEDLGYRYAHFCFTLPPLRFLEVLVIKIEPDWWRKADGRARLVFKSRTMQAESFEVRVFVNQSRPSARSKTDENPNYAGSVGFFGMGPHGGDKMPVASSSRAFDVGLDITDALRSVNEGGEEAELYLLPVGVDGKQFDPERIAVDELELMLE